MFDDPVLQAVLLGILQGVTEFLPISSSAHLLLTPWLVDWEPMGLTFDVLLHVGTLLAILIYFREDWKGVIRQTLKQKHGVFDPRKARPALPALLLVATLPAIVLGGLFGGLVEETLREVSVTAFNLAAFGLVLWWGDRSGSKRRSVEEFGVRDALWVGLAQALALAPGVSRSGITMAAALLLGFKRPAAARFSFLMAAPVIALAALARSYTLWTEPEAAVAVAPMLAGVAAAAISGLASIRFLLGFLRARSFLPFVVYRILLAGVVLGLWWSTS